MRINGHKFNILKEFDLYDPTFEIETNFIRLNDKYERNVETLNIFNTNLL